MRHGVKYPLDKREVLTPSIVYSSKKTPGGFLFSMERGVHLAFQQGEISSGKVFGKLNLNFF